MRISTRRTFARNLRRRGLLAVVKPHGRASGADAVAHQFRFDAARGHIDLHGENFHHEIGALGRLRAGDPRLDGGFVAKQFRVADALDPAVAS